MAIKEWSESVISRVAYGDSNVLLEILKELKEIRHELEHMRMNENARANYRVLYTMQSERKY